MRQNLEKRQGLFGDNTINESKEVSTMQSILDFLIGYEVSFL